MAIGTNREAIVRKVRVLMGIILFKNKIMMVSAIKIASKVSSFAFIIFTPLNN